MDSSASRRHFLQLASLGLTVPMLSARVSTARQAETAPKKQANTIIKPPILRSGDTIGLIAPSGNAFGSEEIQTAKENMEKYGFKVELGKHINAQKGYLAGTDEERAADVNDMFRRPEIRGIATFLGGYGCCRILPFLNYNLIRSYPKVLVGYSDITSFLLAIHQETGLVTFHGSSGLTKVGDYSRMHFRQTIMSSNRIGEVAKPPKASEGNADSNNRLITIVPGKVTGSLIGGNLTLVTNLLGTPYEPDTRGKILFLEEVGEESYRVDRMLTQLWLAGKLQDAAGFALGRFVDCESKDYPPSSPQTLSLETVLRDRFIPLRKPTLYNLMFGHIEENAVLPIGIMATLNSTEQTLTLNENAVV